MFSEISNNIKLIQLIPHTRAIEIKDGKSLMKSEKVYLQRSDKAPQTMEINKMFFKMP